METANSCNYDLMTQVDRRENKVLKGSLWFISFRERKWIPTKMLWPAIQKIIQGSLKWASELSQFTAYQSIVGYCSLKTANSDMQLWSYDACWSTRKQSAERKSVVCIFPRKEVDPDQNAVTSYSKDNSRKPISRLMNCLSLSSVCLELKRNRFDLAVVKEFFSPWSELAKARKRPKEMLERFVLLNSVCFSLT